MAIVKCSVCGKEFDKPNNRIRATEAAGKVHTCSRKCASSISNNARRCEPTSKNAAKTRRDKEKNPDRNHAREIVREAIKAGKIIPKEECEFCGDVGVSLEAHHPDHSYPLLLIYLCRKCHKFFDAQEDRGIGLATDYS